MEAYGCSASFADSEMISGMVQNGGHTLVDDSSEADLNVVVTCSVKDATANRMIHRIKSLESSKTPLIVAGCLPKAESGTVERFASRASMMGPDSIGNTLQVVQDTLAGSRVVMLEKDDDTSTVKVGLPKVRLNPIVGIVEIASGCKSECTFCQTKLAKGDLSSYRPGDITRQVRTELADGCKEIWLTSTDNGCYGLDIGTDLPELIDSVAEIPGDHMIRVGMMNPMYMPRIMDRLLDSMRSDRVFKFLHVPVQSGSNRILAEMARGHTAETFRRTVSQARSKVGEITISTDIIVGFPTETESEFEDTIRLIKETKPDIVNLSRYSARPGTKAAAMKEEGQQLEQTEIKRRSGIMTEVIAKISTESNCRWMGWKGDVLFDERTSEGIRGRNFAYKPIYVKGESEGIKLGERRTVCITGTGQNHLSGEMIVDGSRRQ